MNEQLTRSVMGNRLLSLRKERGLSRLELARDTCVGETTISSIENNPIYEPRIGTLESLSGYFGVTIDYLSGVSDSKRGFFNHNW